MMASSKITSEMESGPQITFRTVKGDFENDLLKFFENGTLRAIIGTLTLKGHISGLVRPFGLKFFVHIDEIRIFLNSVNRFLRTPLVFAVFHFVFRKWAWEQPNNDTHFGAPLARIGKDLWKSLLVSDKYFIALQYGTG